LSIQQAQLPGEVFILLDIEAVSILVSWVSKGFRIAPSLHYYGAGAKERG
jgi:hypothetical protein